MFIDGGSVLVDTVTAPIASLTVGGPDGGALTLGQFGRLTINDDYIQNDTGAMSIDVGGSSEGQFGKLAVVGQAMLDGDFRIRSLNGFAPSVGAQIEFLSAAGGLAGTTFGAPTLVPDLSGNAVWQLIYQPGAVVAQVLSDTVLGDLNGDSQITVADWSIFKAGQGTNFAGLDQLQAYLRGDLDGDFDHDLSDFIAFRVSYENTHGIGSFAKMVGNVPEPTSATLLIAAATLLLGLATRNTKRHKNS